MHHPGRRFSEVKPNVLLSILGGQEPGGVQGVVKETSCTVVAVT